MFELPNKTVSLWSYINRTDVQETLLNPLYTPSEKIIWPSVAPMSLVTTQYLFSCDSAHAKVQKGVFPSGFMERSVPALVDRSVEGEGSVGRHRRNSQGE